jgi:hypothetical protein
MRSQEGAKKEIGQCMRRWDVEVTSNTSKTTSLRNGARRIRLAFGCTEFARAPPTRRWVDASCATETLRSGSFMSRPHVMVEFNIPSFKVIKNQGEQTFSNSWLYRAARSSTRQVGSSSKQCMKLQELCSRGIYRQMRNRSSSIPIAEPLDSSTRQRSAKT